MTGVSSPTINNAAPNQLVPLMSTSQDIPQAATTTPQSASSFPSFSFHVLRNEIQINEKGSNTGTMNRSIGLKNRGRMAMRSVKKRTAINNTIRTQTVIVNHRRVKVDLG